MIQKRTGSQERPLSGLSGPQSIRQSIELQMMTNQIFYGIMAWARFEDGHLTGLAGLLLVIYIPFYILAHDPKQD